MFEAVESYPKAIHEPVRSDRPKGRPLIPKKTASVRGAQRLPCATFDLGSPAYHVRAELYERQVRHPIPKSKKFVRGVKLRSASFDLDFQAVASREPTEPELSKTSLKKTPALSIAYRTYRKSDAVPDTVAA
ncbi:MAG: hypothetical protein DMG86_21845 [Acidobacteria bacterium]|nr:MAG: hypothetical protein DMG86_21845 [Acidobacteriota bacterium]